MSSDVRGVSGCGSCTGSNMDCREAEVSVLLLLSKAGGFWRLGAGAVCGTGAGPELRGLDIPDMSMFLKPSTSNDGFIVPGVDRSAAGRSRQSCQQMYVSKPGPHPVICPFHVFLCLGNGTCRTSTSTHLCSAPPIPRSLSHVAQW